jgi:hypothetical protein
MPHLLRPPARTVEPMAGNTAFAHILAHSIAGPMLSEISDYEQIVDRLFEYALEKSLTPPIARRGK